MSVFSYCDQRTLLLPLVPGLVSAATAVALLNQCGALGDAAAGSTILGRRLAARRLTVRVVLRLREGRWQRREPKVSVDVVRVLAALLLAGRHGDGLVERELGAEVGELQHVGEAELVERHRLLTLSRLRWWCWCGRRVRVVAKHVVDHLGPARRVAGLPAPRAGLPERPTVSRDAVVIALFVSPVRSGDWLPATATFYGGVGG